MKYKYIQIIRDLLSGTITIGQLRVTRKTLTTLDKCIHLKLSALKNIKLLETDNLQRSITIYNRYTTGKKIPIIPILNLIDAFMDYVKQHNINSNSVIGNLLKLISNGGNTEARNILAGFQQKLKDIKDGKYNNKYS